MYETYNGVRACEGMTKYVGRIATIVSGIGNHLGVQLDIGSFWWTWTYEMFDQNWKSESENYMKTSEFKTELKKLGYTFEDEYLMNKQGKPSAYVSTVCVNKMDTTFGYEISPKVFSLMSRYATTPIAERNDKPKLFNIQIIKGNWGRQSWLYRDIDDEISIAISAYNNELDQQWTLEQIKEYGIEDEAVYKRVPVEDE